MYLIFKSSLFGKEEKEVRIKIRTISWRGKLRASPTKNINLNPSI